MTDWHIEDGIATGGAPDVEDLHKLAAQGFKAVLDLREEDPAEQDLPPSQERGLVYSAAMEYKNVPIIMNLLNEDDFNAFRSHLNDLPKPVYVHCAGGKRAILLTVMDQAIRQNKTGEQALYDARDKGIDFTEMPLIATMIERYVNRFIAG